MLKTLLILSLCLAFYDLKAEDDFGITTVKFTQNNSDTTFTFRHHKLIHEVTLLSINGSEKLPSWVERFFIDGKEILLRAGKSPDHFSTHYHGPLPVSFTKGGNRISLGSEHFELGKSGFYQVILDPSVLLKESTIDDPVFSTKALDLKRAEYLHN